MMEVLHVIADRSQDIKRVESVSIGEPGCTDDGRPIWPSAVEIQPTARCHRICTFCSHIVRNHHGAQMTLPLALGLLDELEPMGVQRIALSGGGEPLYWGVSQLTAVALRAARFAKVSLTSSGDQLWDRAAGALIPSAAKVLAPYSELYINVPDVDPQVWRRLIVGGNTWEEAEGLLKALVALRMQCDELQYKVYVVVVVTLLNVKRIGLIDRVLSDCGVDGIYYKQFKNFEQRNVQRLKADDATLLRLIHGAVCSEPMSQSLQRFQQQIGQPTGGTARCWANRLAYSAIVDPSGEVFPCTPTVGQREFAIGTLQKQSFTSLWSSAQRAGVLKVLDERALAGGCPAECREHAVNRVVEQLIGLR